MVPNTKPVELKVRAMTQKLLESLTEDNFFFDQLVDVVPAKLYIAGQSGDNFNPRYHKSQAKDSKESRRADNKRSKIMKFDPSLVETTTQAKQRLEGDFMMPKKLSSKQPKPTMMSASRISSTNGFNDDIAVKKSRIQILREKLHAKLFEKRGSRPMDPSSVSKRAARRADKKKRQEESLERNRKKTMSVAEQNESSNKRLKRSPSTAPGIVNLSTDLAQVDFGRLAGLNPIGNGNYNDVNKALKNLSKKKCLEKMLADAESKKQRLVELKKSNKSENKKKVANIEWVDALKEATGERVKDDPIKIKKALKRKSLKKIKSAEAWKTRMETTQHKMNEKQKIRNHNLSRRKLGGSAGANLSKKRIESKKEGNDNNRGSQSGRAGFEGKKQAFLNKKEQ